jgi:alpha-tubulin suppressor-like RCC1 family protein
MNIEASWSSQAEHSIFVTPEGDYVVWGNNKDAALGTGDNVSAADPVPLRFPESEGGRKAEIKSLACGQRHCLAVMTDGRVFGWGRGREGQLGESPEDRLVPTLLNFPETPVFAAAGSHFSAVITKGGNLYMGGQNGHAELGIDCRGLIPFPTNVLGLPPVVEVSAGWNHTVARTGEGEIWSWGKSDDGETGQGEQGTKITPTLLPPFPEKIVKIACGGFHSFFLGEKGTLWSCGWNYHGNTGHPKKTNSCSILTPQILKIGEGQGRVKEIAAGWCNSMALLEDGSLWVWGNNSDGQLGSGNHWSKGVPTQLVFPPAAGEDEKVGVGGEERKEEGDRVVGIGCCCDHCFVVTRNGDLWIWGRALGLGGGLDLLVPKKVEGLKVRLPKPRSQRWWKEVGVWLFLGRVSGDSQFVRMPVEIIFHFVSLAFGW